jgi:hypothetical protein
MKIGLSLSRCVRDIVEGHVNINDVLILITRTDFDPTVQEQWDDIWNGYTSIAPEWYGLDESAVKAVIMDLWETGRVHQPRKFGAIPSRRREIWLETVLVDQDLETRPAVKEAWDQFQILAGLTNTSMDKKYQ